MTEIILRQPVKHAVCRRAVNLWNTVQSGFFGSAHDIVSDVLDERIQVRFTDGHRNDRLCCDSGYSVTSTPFQNATWPLIFDAASLGFL